MIVYTLTVTITAPDGMATAIPASIYPYLLTPPFGLKTSTKELKIPKNTSHEYPPIFIHYICNRKVGLGHPNKLMPLGLHYLCIR